MKEPTFILKCDLSNADARLEASRLGIVVTKLRTNHGLVILVITENMPIWINHLEG